MQKVQEDRERVEDILRENQRKIEEQKRKEIEAKLKCVEIM
jgi:hypothetical protein